MNALSLVLFLHISGALGMAAAIGLEGLGLQQVRQATMPALAGAGLRIMGSTRKLGFPSMLVAIITGLYMMATGGGPTPWLYTTLGAVVLLILLTAASGPRVAAIGRGLARETAPLSGSFHSLANHPLLSLSLYMRIAIILGIVFLKTVKPDLGGSLLAMGVAILLGLASAFPVARGSQTRGAQME